MTFKKYPLDISWDAEADPGHSPFGRRKNFPGLVSRPSLKWSDAFKIGMVSTSRPKEAAPRAKGSEGAPRGLKATLILRPLRHDWSRAVSKQRVFRQPL